VQFLTPVSGHITQRFGNQIEGGGRADGVIYNARAGQMVLAPADGTVRYAGPFRRYGRVVIIDHGREYHSVLAGPLALMAQVGQPVRAGEPIGRLDQSIATSNSLLQSGISGSNTNELPLYFESRYRGRPQNPLLFVASETN
jgi:murein hydrolase activator